MTALAKFHPEQQYPPFNIVEDQPLSIPHRPVFDPNEPIFVNSATYLNDPKLLDNEFFSYYFAYCHEQSPRLAKYKIDGYKDEYAYSNKVRLLVSWGKLPQDYHRRLVLRQIAQGTEFSKKLLSDFNIVFYDPPPQIDRLQREHRQPQGIADFVLIEHSNWQQYENMRWLYNKLPQHLPLARYKKEPTNQYIDKSAVLHYPYYTPNRRGDNSYIHKIVFDIDPINKSEGDLYSNNFFNWADAGLPPPNLIIAHPSKNGSYQLVYLLLAPLRTTKDYPNVRIMNWYHRIVKCMTALLGADKEYNGGRSKNPFSSEHDLYVSGAEPYTLQQLSDQCDLLLWEQEQRQLAHTTTKTIKGVYSYIDPTKASNQPKYKAVLVDSEYWRHGRNGQAFESIRYRIYPKAYLIPADLELVILNEYNNYQKNFDKPMPDCDIRASVKSILNYCIATFGVGSGKLDQSFKDKLLAMGYVKSDRAKQLATIHARNSAKLRWVGYEDKQTQALTLLKQGIKQVDICRQLGVSKMTLHRWKKANKIN